MENRIAFVCIIVKNRQSSLALHGLLHDFGQHIIGRMGIPYQQKDMSIISVIMDAPNDVISALTGKLGMIQDVTVKIAYAKGEE